MAIPFKSSIPLGNAALSALRELSLHMQADLLQLMKRETTAQDNIIVNKQAAHAAIESSVPRISQFIKAVDTWVKAGRVSWFDYERNRLLCSVAMEKGVFAFLKSLGEKGERTDLHKHATALAGAVQRVGEIINNQPENQQALDKRLRLLLAGVQSTAPAEFSEARRHSFFPQGERRLQTGDHAVLQDYKNQLSALREHYETGCRGLGTRSDEMHTRKIDLLCRTLETAIKRNVMDFSALNRNVQEALLHGNDVMVGLASVKKHDDFTPYSAVQYTLVVIADLEEWGINFGLRRRAMAKAPRPGKMPRNVQVMNTNIIGLQMLMQALDKNCEKYYQARTSNGLDATEALRNAKDSLQNQLIQNPPYTLSLVESAKACQEFLLTLETEKAGVKAAVHHRQSIHHERKNAVIAEITAPLQEMEKMTHKTTGWLHSVARQQGGANHHEL